jgi:hypothetical protein
MNIAGKVVVKPQFIQVCEFSDGMGRIYINGKWGYIDSTGKYIAEPQFIDANDFYEGLAAVNVITNDKGKWGYLDKRGRISIEPQFYSASDFSDGLAEVLTESKGLLFIDKTGKFVFKTEHNCGKFREGLAIVMVGDFTTKDIQFGFMDMSGKIVIEPKFSYADYFSEGVARVCIGGKVQWDGFTPIEVGGKWGYIDKSGKMVIKAQFDGNADCEDANFSEGLAVVWVRGKAGYIDKSGEIAISPQFDWAGRFSEGLAPVRLCGDEVKLGYIDRTGKMVIEPKFDVAEDFSEGIARVYSDYPDKFGYIDKMGNFVWYPTK